MGNEYLDSAFDKIYKHPKWREVATEYESVFAGRLFNAPIVKEAAHQALSRFAKLFQVYYGEYKDLYAGKQDQLEAVGTVADVASELEGSKVKYSKVLSETLLARAAESKEKDGSTSGAGQIGNAMTGVAEGDEAGKTAAEVLNRENIEGVINTDGNLREMMTMLYNGTFANGGRNAEEISHSRSFKNMMVTLTDKKAMELESFFLHSGDEDLEKVHFDMGLMRDQEDYEKKTDILDDFHILSNFSGSMDKFGYREGPKKGALGRAKSKIARLFYWSRHRRKSNAPEDRKGLGLKYYEEHRMGLSDREKKHGLDDAGKLKWKEGSAYFHMKEPVTAKGMLQTAGPSGTTRRMLAAYKMIGASQEDLLGFRLALIAWMAGSHDHSVFEILKGSHQVGVKGMEKLNEAAKMYMSIDPLTTRELRAYAFQSDDKVPGLEYAKVGSKLGEFPHELLYREMLGEFREKREKYYEEHPEIKEWLEQQSEDGEANPYFYMESLEHVGGSDLALNIYTSGAYKIMNPGMKMGRLGRIVGKMMLKYKKFNGNGEAPANGYTDFEGQDSELRSGFVDLSRMSARMSKDALIERGQEGGGETKTAGDKGIVFRGGKMGKDVMKGNSSFTTKGLTSTSKNITQAEAFYRKAGNKALLSIFRLHGSGIPVQEISQYVGEEEILLPPGTKFKQTGGPFKVSYSGKSVSKASNPDDPDALNAAEFEEVDSPVKHKKEKYQKRRSKREEYIRQLAESYRKRTGGDPKLPVDRKAVEEQTELAGKGDDRYTLDWDSPAEGAAPVQESQEDAKLDALIEEGETLLEEDSQSEDVDDLSEDISMDSISSESETDILDSTGVADAGMEAAKLLKTEFSDPGTVFFSNMYSGMIDLLNRLGKTPKTTDSAKIAKSAADLMLYLMQNNSQVYDRIGEVIPASINEPNLMKALEDVENLISYELLGYTGIQQMVAALEKVGVIDAE